MPPPQKGIPLEEFKVDQQSIEIAELIQEALQLSKTTYAWDVVENVVDQLEQEKHFSRTTFKEAIVATLINSLEKDNLLTPESLEYFHATQVKPYSKKLSMQHYAEHKKHPAFKRLNRAVESMIAEQDWVENCSRNALLTHLVDALLESGALKTTEAFDYAQEKPSIYDLQIKLIPHYDIANAEGVKIQELAYDGTELWAIESTQTSTTC